MSVICDLLWNSYANIKVFCIDFVSKKNINMMFIGGAALDLNAVPPKPFKWMTDMTWLNLVQLSTLRQFTNILNQIINNEKGWKTW